MYVKTKNAKVGTDMNIPVKVLKTFDEIRKKSMKFIKKIQKHF